MTISDKQLLSLSVGPAYSRFIYNNLPERSLPRYSVDGETEVVYCDLNEKRPPQAQYLTIWSPVGGPNLSLDFINFYTQS